MSQRRRRLHAELASRAVDWRRRRVAEAFADEATRHRELCREGAGLTLDFSKNRLGSAELALLLELATEQGLEARMAAMFRGDPVNVTEQRAALHVALRARPGNRRGHVQPEIAEAVQAVRQRMRILAEAFRHGDFMGGTGAPITAVVNLGIGGSHLGPLMACTALRDEAAASPRVHFVSNVDGADIAWQLRQLDPARTAFIIASKSFTTPETLQNARTARAWLAAGGIPEARLGQHFLAITARPDRAREFGIEEDHLLPMWDWVGGRYSLWSAIGLPIAIAIGMDRFEHFLAGAEDMDRHFREAAWRDNLPVLLALVGAWNTNWLGAETLAVVPYEERLAHLPAYLQQLEMESNGKRVTLDNAAVESHTAPVLWGGLGTNVQHAFFQLLHQGTRIVPVDFILALRNPASPPGHHDLLVANCLAQAEALMRGRTAMSLEGELPEVPGVDLPMHRAMPGNQPSNLILMEALTPHTLGALIALYEHKTFVQGVLWEINSFDQWGVELGKMLAERLLEEIAAGAPSDAHDASTHAALARYLASRHRD